MKFDLKEKKMSLSMVIIVILCLVVTGIIVVTIANQVGADATQPWFIQQTLDTHEPVKLENSYIISNEEDVLKFVHNKEIYTIEGKLSDDFCGVADILVENGKIARVYAKPDITSGTIQRYTDANIEIMETEDENTTQNLTRKTKVPVYKVTNGTVQEIEWDAMILGTTAVNAVMEEGQVAALIIDEEVVPTDIRVLLRNGDSIFRSDVYVKKMYENTIVRVNEVLSNNNESSITLSDKNGLVLCDASGNPLGEAYEGEFTIIKTEQGFVIINKLPIETYLKYVIPSEMPKTFAHEALKAQAVCARTYAYSQMENGAYAQYGANLDDTTDYQVYHSFGRYTETDAAVEETKGEIITHNGQLITCYYFSTCSGVTNDFSVWGDSTAAYISMKGLEEVKDLDLTKKADFSKYMSSSYETNDMDSPYYRWKSTLNIETEKETAYGKLKAIKVVKRNAAGYVTELLMDYEKKDITLTKENDIRKALGIYHKETTLNDGQKRTELSMIPSACFEVLETSDDTITLRGGGYGHGIGLSQYGANKMAQKDYNYKEIIQYYYSGVVVE